MAHQDGSVSLVYSVMTPKADVFLPRYGHHLLRSIAFQDEFFRWGTGIVDDLWSTNFTRMSRIHIPLPSMDLQHRIAHHLDEIDLMIMKMDELTEVLRSRRTAEFDSVLAPLFKSESFPIWSVLSPVKSQNHPNDQVLSVYREYGVIPKSSRDDNHNRTPDNLSTYQLVLPGDLVINKMKAWQGSLGVSNHKGIVSPDYQVARPMNGVVPRYLHAVLRSSFMIPQYRARSIGVRPSQWRLYWDDFASLRIPIPSPEEQTRIASHLDKAAGRIDAMLAKVADLKKSLVERSSAYIADAIAGRKEVA
jgi:type I restriction enzyme S subunit